MNHLISLVGVLHGRFIKQRQMHRIVDYLVTRLPTHGIILDVGCGSGELARLVMQRKPGLSIVGADVFVRSAVAIPVADFDGRHLPFANRTFDGVIMVDVVHHADDQPQILHEVARVTAGPVLIKDHVARNQADRALLAFMDWVGNRSYGVQLPYKYLSPTEWAAFFAQVGMNQVEAIPVRKLYPFPFSLLFERHLQVLYAANTLTNQQT